MKIHFMTIFWWKVHLSCFFWILKLQRRYKVLSPIWKERTPVWLLVQEFNCCMGMQISTAQSGWQIRPTNSAQIIVWARWNLRRVKNNQARGWKWFGLYAVLGLLNNQYSQLQQKGWETEQVQESTGTFKLSPVP